MKEVANAMYDVMEKWNDGELTDAEAYLEMQALLTQDVKQ